MVPSIPITSRISLGSVTNETLPDLVDLHARVFPVSYGEKFYEEVMNAGDLAKLIVIPPSTILVYYDNQYAGAVCCRLEPSKYANYTARVYMMTLGVLKNYRSLGLGSILIENIMENARRATNPIVTSLYLHVQTANEQAIRFYTRNGFRIQAVVYDYYKLIENRDAYILTRPVFHIYES